MKQIQIVMMLASLLTGAQAYAGAESHGGQVVVCPGKETVMLDYYQATLPTLDGGNPELVDISKMSSQDVLDLFNSRLPTGGQLEVQYVQAQSTIGPIGTWLEGSLQSVSDSDPAYTLPVGCSLQQVAIRQDATMYVDPSVLNMLSPAQQGILFAHEALYYVASEINNLDTSVEVRMVIRDLLMKNIDFVDFAKSAHEMGSELFWWQSFVNQDYYPATSSKLKGYFLPVYNPLLDGTKMVFQSQFYFQGTSSPFQVGDMTCSDWQSEECQTSGGLYNCELKHMNHAFGNGHAVNIFEIVCADQGIDEYVGTDPDAIPAGTNSSNEGK